MELPIVVNTDNIGAMFMAQNSLTGVHTRHVDSRYHFIRDRVQNGSIKNQIVKSIKNDSDIFTKSVNQETYERHTRKFLKGLRYLNVSG